MIVINCQDCGTELAAEASVCPRCGALVGRSPGAGLARHQDPRQADGRSGKVAGPATRQPHLLTSLATWLTAMLAGFAIATLTGFAVFAFDVVAFLLLLTISPVFLVWLYHASRNAEESGYPQRRSAGWAIGGWFVPVIFLWFPYQVVSDIWRAGQAPERRARIPWPVIAWWTCWLLAWVTGFQFTHTARSVRISYALYSTSGSRLVLTIAAVLLILVVRTVSMGPLADRRDPSVTAGTGVYPVAGPETSRATPPVTSDANQEVANPAAGWGGAPPPSPPLPAGLPDNSRMTRGDPSGISLMRASDADRDRAAEVINSAMAEGRLTPAEHSERLDAIYAAKTRADLVPLVRDLPAEAASLPGGRLRPLLRSRPAKELAALSIGIGATALIAVVTIRLATPAPTMGRSARTPVPATGRSASTQAPATPTTAPAPLSRDARWLNGLDSLQTRMNGAMGSGSSIVTPTSLRSLAMQLRRCTPELARLGPPTAQLRRVYLQARQGCADYDQGANCYAAAASAFADSGPAVSKFTRLLDCGDAGANKGSELLGNAVANGFGLQPS